MAEYEKTPLKLYIQDVYRATRSEQNKYVYEILGIYFKNVMLHGVVTSVYNASSRSINIELSDCTGTVQVFCDSAKKDNNITQTCLKDLTRDFANSYKHGDDKINTMSFLLNKIQKKHSNLLKFQEGDYASIVGDVFVDDSNTRMISAYDWHITNMERDLIWMEELRHLYNQCYIK